LKGLSGVEPFRTKGSATIVLNAGAIGFLSKPYSNEKLAKFLDMALANQSPE
jgi:FixJ family two-component response regulator